MEEQQLLPPLANTTLSPLPGAIPELRPLRPLLNRFGIVAAPPSGGGAEQRSGPDDGGWACVAGHAAPEREAELVLTALDAWAQGVSHQAKRCGRKIDAARARELLQASAPGGLPSTLVELAAAAAAATATLRAGGGDDEPDEDPEPEPEQEKPLTPPAPPSSVADSAYSVADSLASSSIADSQQEEGTEKDTKKPKKLSEKDKMRAKDKAKKEKKRAQEKAKKAKLAEQRMKKKGGSEKSEQKGPWSDDRKSNLLLAGKAAKQERINARRQPAGDREAMWIVASDEAWTGRTASISRILEQHQLDSTQEDDIALINELAELRNKLREMSPLDLANEEINRPVHQPVERPGETEAFSFHSAEDAYTVSPLDLEGAGLAAAPALDELDYAKTACPRLNLLTPPQLVRLLHMTHPDEIEEVWSSICSFDSLVYSQPPSVSSTSRTMAAVEVVAVRQKRRDGRSLTLPLARAYPTANFAYSETADDVPQANWIEGLFGLIVESQREQLESVRDEWPGQGRYLCDFLRPEGASEDVSAAAEGVEFCCMQVAMLAVNLRLSEILQLDGALAVSGVDLETTIGAETSIPRLSDTLLWDEAEELVRDELAAARKRVKEASAEGGATEGTLERTLMQTLVVRLIGLRCALCRRDVTEMVRFRMAPAFTEEMTESRVERGLSAESDEIEVSMLVKSTTDGTTSVTSWLGCVYGWELFLSGDDTIVATEQTAAAYRTIFAGLTDVASIAEPLPDPTWVRPTTIMEGPPGSGKAMVLQDACTALFGISYTVIDADHVGTDTQRSSLAVLARALAKFPLMLIVNKANCVARSSLEDAMAQPQLVPCEGIGGFSGFAINWDPEQKDALHSVASMKRLLARNDTDSLRLHPPDDLLVEYALFSVSSGCCDAAAFVAAAFFGSDEGREICKMQDLLRLTGLLAAKEFSGDDDAAITATFRWLGREITFAAWERGADFTGCVAADAMGAWGRLTKLVGDKTACRRYHERLLVAVYSTGAHLTDVERTVTEHLSTGRQFHAADAVALLANFPELVTKHKLISMKPAAGGVAVSWPGTRNVCDDYLAAHISGSGEGHSGPGALWAGKSAWGLLGKAIETEPERPLAPMVLALDGALTTLELLPAIYHSSGAKELLTSPPVQAILQAKWRLLRPYWLLEFGCFAAVFMFYLAYALLDAPTARGVLLAFACLFTLPLFWVEWRQATAVKDMCGVGASAARLRGEPGSATGSKLLVQHMRYSYGTTYHTMQNVMDLCSLVLIWISAFAALLSDSTVLTTDGSASAGSEMPWGRRSTSLVAIAVLTLCVKLISYLKINSKMGFLVSVITTCVLAMRQFLVFVLVVIVVFATTFHLQFAALAVPANGTVEPPYGGGGSNGLMTSIWRSFLFATLGDFDPEIFWAGGFATIVFFVAITLLMNVVMLNVLIAIVSDAFKTELDQVEFITSRLTAETLFGIDCWFPRKRCFAFDSDTQVKDGDEYHNQVEYHRADKLLAWEYKEGLKCPLAEATLHVLSARASAEVAAQQAEKDLGDEGENSKEAEAEAQAALEAQRAQEQKHREDAAAMQTAHEAQAAALLKAHQDTKAELEAAHVAHKAAASAAREAVDAAKAFPAQLDIVAAERRESEAKLKTEIDTAVKDLAAHKMRSSANDGELNKLEEAHTSAQEALAEAQAANDELKTEAAKELKVSQELAQEDQARLEAELEQLRADKAELEGIADQLRAEVDAAATKGKRKKKK